MGSSRPSAAAAWLILAATLAAPAAAAEVRIVTVAPGPGAETVFGHTGVRILEAHDDTYITLVGDVGGAAGAARFVAGQSGFRWTSQPTGTAYALYRLQARDIVEQTLAMPADAEARLSQDLQARVAAGAASYGLLEGNCAGAVADAVARAWPQLRFPAAPERSAGQAAATLAERRPLLELGMRLGLGIQLDSRAPWPLVPDDLRTMLASASADGAPAVLQTGAAFDAGPLPEEPAWPVVAATASLLVGAAGAAAAAQRGHSRAAGNLAAVPLVAAGALGCILLLLALLPRGPVSMLNPELLWAWPTHAAWPWLRRREWAGRYAVAVAGAALLMMAAALMRPVPTPWALWVWMAATLLAAGVAWRQAAVHAKPATAAPFK